MHHPFLRRGINLVSGQIVAAMADRGMLNHSSNHTNCGAQGFGCARVVQDMV